jgi:hypothetical protein
MVDRRHFTTTNPGKHNPIVHPNSIDSPNSDNLSLNPENVLSNFVNDRVASKSFSAEDLNMVASLLQLPEVHLKPESLVSVFSIFRYSLQKGATVEQLMHAVADMLESRSPQALRSCNFRQVMTCIGHLRGWTADSLAIRRLIKLFANRINSFPPNLSLAMSHKSLANMMLGLMNMSSNSADVRYLLSALTPKLLHYSSAINCQTIANTFYGMKSMTDCHEVHEMLAALVTLIRKCDEVFPLGCIRSVMYGLQGLSSDSKIVREILSIMADKLSASREVLSCRDMKDCLYGMQNMSAEHGEVRRFLSVLSDRVEGMTENMTEIIIGNAIYGLKRMSSNHPEVLRLVRILAEKVASSDAQLTAKSVAASFFGLRSMNAESNEVRRLLAELMKLILKHPPERLSLYAISSALNGLNNMSSSYAEVRDALAFFGGALKADSSVLSGLEITTSFYGLKNMDSNHTEVVSLLEALHIKLRNLNEKLSPDNICGVLLGLKSVSAVKPPTASIISTITTHISSNSAVFSGQHVSNMIFYLQNKSSNAAEVRELLSATSVRAESVSMNSREIGNAFYGLKTMSDSSEEVKQLLRIMKQQILSCPDGLDDIAIANILFGLRNMSSDCAEVVGILSAVGRFMKLNPSNTPKRISVIANAACGLKNCSSDAPEVKDVLAHVAKWLGQCEEVPTHAQVSGILLGLSRSKDDCDSVLNIIQFAIDSIEKHNIQLDKEGIRNSFKCLQSMSGEARQLTRLVEVLKKNILGCEETFTANDIKHIQSSLSNFSRRDIVDSEISGAILTRNLKQ